MADTDQTVYRRSTPVVTSWYDRDSEESISEAIIGALAEAEGICETEVAPMYETIDLDAVNRLFASYGETSDSVLLNFSFENWDVFVRADGRIRVCDGARFTDPESVFRDSADSTV
jgi:hypothetical protein